MPSQSLEDLQLQLQTLINNMQTVICALQQPDPLQQQIDALQQELDAINQQIAAINVEIATISAINQQLQDLLNQLGWVCPPTPPTQDITLVTGITLECTPLEDKGDTEAPVRGLYTTITVTANPADQLPDGVYEVNVYAVGRVDSNYPPEWEGYVWNNTTDAQWTNGSFSIELNHFWSGTILRVITTINGTVMTSNDVTLV